MTSPARIFAMVLLSSLVKASDLVKSHEELDNLLKVSTLRYHIELEKGNFKCVCFLRATFLFCLRKREKIIIIIISLHFSTVYSLILSERWARLGPPAERGVGLGVCDV